MYSVGTYTSFCVWRLFRFFWQILDNKVFLRFICNLHGNFNTIKLNFHKSNCGSSLFSVMLLINSPKKNGLRLHTFFTSFYLKLWYIQQCVGVINLNFHESNFIFGTAISYNATSKLFMAESSI